MPKYKIEWTREQWFFAYVDADSAKEAEDKFWLGEVGDETLFGEEIQQPVDVEDTGE